VRALADSMMAAASKGNKIFTKATAAMERKVDNVATIVGVDRGARRGRTDAAS
jgi:hypothetical protein